MSQIAFNPNDPLQSSFLSALALGETGSGGVSAANEGYGGVSTSGDATDQFGFPSFAGGSTSAGPTHAAGIFQFEPGTWDTIASQFGLNFSNPSDQEAGAWYEAQQTYKNATGQDLESALQNGDYSSIQSALAGVWPSVTGNAANPQGLAAAIKSGAGPSLGGANPSAQQQHAALNAANGGSSADGSFVAGIEDFFVRFGLIIAGGVIIVVALWQLLSSTGVVPSPGDTAKAVGKAGASALAVA